MALPVGTLLNELFTNPPAAGTWGVADDGHTFIVNPAADFSLDGVSGLITLTNIVSHAATPNLNAVADQDAIWVMYFGNTLPSQHPDQPTINVYLGARFQDINNYYRLRITFKPDDSIWMQYQQIKAAIATPLTANVHVGDLGSTATHWVFRYQVFGGDSPVVRAKAWINGTGEPPAWDLPATRDPAPLTGIGGATIRAVTSAGRFSLVINTGGWLIDDVSQAQSSPPVNVQLPVISDSTPTVGDVLKCSHGTWSGSPQPTGYSYQWQIATTVGGVYSNIGGATSQSYTVLSGDATKFLRCQVTATNGVSPDGVATSSPTGAVAASSSPSAPVNTALPVVNVPAPHVNDVIATSDGTWTGSPAPTFGYQWRSAATSGGAYTNIGGATSSTYTVQAGDLGRFLRCRVTATNASGSPTADTDPTSAVAQDTTPPPNQPTITGAPPTGHLPSGTASVSLSYSSTTPPALDHYEVSEDNGATWTTHASPYSLALTQGQSKTFSVRAVNATGDVSPIASVTIIRDQASGGTTGTTYTPGAGDVGAVLRARVQAVNAGGSSGWVTTGTTLPVEGPVAAPTNTVLPGITGPTVRGYALVCDGGQWSDPNAQLHYQWKSGSTSVGTDSAAYTTQPSDDGASITCVVTASNNAGSNNATSNAIVIDSMGTPPSNITPPQIIDPNAGSADVGDDLLVQQGVWSGTQPFTFTYQWRRSSTSSGPWTPIPGATGTSYTLQPGDLADWIDVVEDASNGF